MTKKMSRKTRDAQSRATFFRYSAVLSLTAVLLRKLPRGGRKEQEVGIPVITKGHGKEVDRK